SVMAGQTATISLVVTGYSAITTNLTYQWQLNGLDIPGAVSPTYTTPILRETNSGVSYRVLVSIPGKAQFSSSSTLTVTPDTIAPTVSRALNNGTTNVAITFSELVEAQSATNLANYAFSNGVPIFAVTLSANGRGVV